MSKAWKRRMPQGTRNVIRGCETMQERHGPRYLSQASRLYEPRPASPQDQATPGYAYRHFVPWRCFVLLAPTSPDYCIVYMVSSRLPIYGSIHGRQSTYFSPERSSSPLPLILSFPSSFSSSSSTLPSSTCGISHPATANAAAAIAAPTTKTTLNPCRYAGMSTERTCSASSVDSLER